ncbi:MAG: TRAP transporter TatT component family protein [Vicinamibacterales bacterium]|nr:TRAP transporter TatT component family protein [Vicinamibacterales bacterium]
MLTGLPGLPVLGQSADALYADRVDLTSARRAADLWSAALASNPRDFDSARKLARAEYWLGGHAAKSDQRGYYEKGIEAGRRAIAIELNKPDGHFWLAANMGALAESAGIGAGLKYRKPIKTELETVLRLDPAFLRGSADRALGRWYYEVPRLFGGSHKQAEEHLKASLKYKDDSAATHYFLAELYADDGRVADARGEIQKVLDAPIDPEWAPEDREWKLKARQLLTTLKSQR